jgi:hypothetical protein
MRPVTVTEVTSREGAMKKLTFAAAVGVGLLLGLAALGPGPRPAQAQKPEKAPRWEYKAVLFRALDAERHTKQLNDLADDGWEYAGPVNSLPGTAQIAATSVAFRRPKK